MRRFNPTIVCTWLRHFVGAEKAHTELTDSQSRHVSHLIAGGCCAKWAGLTPRRLHQFVQGGALTVRRSQTRSKLYPAESSGSKDAHKMRRFSTYLMHSLGLWCIFFSTKDFLAAFSAVKLVLHDLKYVLPVVQDSKVSPRRPCLRRHHPVIFFISSGPTLM